jgi:hypothetical protein
VSTYFPQEPADEIRAIQDETQKRFAKEVERLKAERSRLIAEGWLCETSFYVWCPTTSGTRLAEEALKREGYDVAHEEDPQSLAVRVFLPYDEAEFDRTRRAIDAVVSPHDGAADSSEIDLNNRRRPTS